jgi:hypothetical protein
MGQVHDPQEKSANPFGGLADLTQVAEQKDEQRYAK